ILLIYIYIRVCQARFFYSFTKKLVCVIFVTSRFAKKMSDFMKPIIYLLTLFMFFSTPVFSQGLSFEKGTWEEAKAKAVKENKIIYLNLCTSRNTLCQRMESSFFSAEQAGNFYNANCINFQADAEKGIGLELAKTYEIKGYPTHLYLHPQTGKVVFRSLGLPKNLNAFVQNGAIAKLEFQDPMPLENYQEKFNSGNYDHAFIKKFLEKNKRLGLDNDPVLDAYVQRFSKTDPVEADVLKTIAAYQCGIENQSFKLLETNQEKLDHLFSRKNYLQSLLPNLFNFSITKAMAAQDNEKFDRLIARVKLADPLDPAFTRFNYEQEYYKSSNQPEKLKAAVDAFFKHVNSFSTADFERLNTLQFEQVIEMIKAQSQGQMS